MDAAFRIKAESWVSRPSRTVTVRVRKPDHTVARCHVEPDAVQPRPTFAVGGPLSFRISSKYLEWLCDGRRVWHFTRDPWERVAEEEQGVSSAYRYSRSAA